MQWKSKYFSSSKYMIEEVHRKIKKKNFADISNFEPMYLKDFVATQQKKNLIFNFSIL